MAARSSLEIQRNASGLDEIYRDIRPDLGRVEERLQALSRSPNRLIAEISDYLFHKGGKRIRPALLILASKLFGYKGQDHILMAAVVESVHTASLIHDDIIDNSTMRRGKESIHNRWGANITVLLGDYLYIKTIGLSLRNDNTRIIRLLSDTSARMIEGEIAEYSRSGDPDISEGEYLDMIHMKTADLIATSCAIGGVLAGAPESGIATLTEYGSRLGSAFQIIDDLLDFTGDAELLGKPVLTDLAEGRITLPLIHHFRMNGKAARGRILELMKNGPLRDDAKKEIVESLRTGGSLEYARSKAEEVAAGAREALDRLPASVHRDTLAAFTSFVLDRNR